MVKDDGPGGKTKGSSSNNNNEASSSGLPPPPFGNHLSDSDSNHSNGGGGNGNGDVFPGNGPTTHHTYSVTLEHQVPAIMKPKRLFEQKMWEDGEEVEKPTHPSLSKQTLEEQPNHAAAFGVLSRPRRTSKAPFKQHDDLSHSSPFTISDAPVQSRARASLPVSHLTIKDLRSRDPGGPGVGVFAKKKIPKGCRFGPMEGVLKCVDRVQPEKGGDMVLLVIANEGTSVLDTKDEGKPSVARNLISHLP